jgi:hypothetical protein
MSCGPALGNFRCPICRAWADDGCDHLDEHGVRAEFRAAADQICEAEHAADVAMVEAMIADELLAKAYWARSA